MSSLRLISRRGWNGATRGGIIFTSGDNRVELSTKFRINEPRVLSAPVLNSPVFQRGFHDNPSRCAPFLFPPIVVKGAYYLARTGISLFPFVRKSNFYQKHAKTLRFLFLVPTVFGVVLIVYSLDRNPITGRLTLTLNDQETESYFEDLKLQGAVESAAVDRVSEKLWKEAILVITETILKASEVKLEGELKPTFIRSKEPHLLLTTSGHLLISSEMLRLFEGDRKLFAAAISHQVAHILCRHSTEATGMTAVFSLFLDFIRVGVYSFSFIYPFVSDAIALALFEAQDRFLDHPFTIKLEEEANIISLHILSRAGYDPTSVLKFWEKLGAYYGPQAQKKKKEENTEAEPTSFLQTKEDFHSLHPISPTHYTHLKAALPPALKVLRLTRDDQPPTEPLSSCRFLQESLRLSKLPPPEL